MSEEVNDSIQVLAIRLSADEDDVHNIQELVFRSDRDGSVGFASLQNFTKLVEENPLTRVYVRDYLGEDIAIHSFTESGVKLIKTRPDVSPRDALLRLPRYKTPTSDKREQSAAERDKDQTTCPPIRTWFWWEYFFR